jgi:hypothetical protein
VAAIVYGSYAGKAKGRLRAITAITAIPNQPLTISAALKLEQLCFSASSSSSGSRLHQMICFHL